MAEDPQSTVVFDFGCVDCGRREPNLPAPLPKIGDDFDWATRDYDGFRLFMLEELAARFPERKRWSPADLEVVLVEAFAAGLDQLSDMADRIAAEAYLETARQPSSVRRLLSMIGYDAVAEARAKKQILPSDDEDALLRYWTQNPTAMDEAKREGPPTIHNQMRMVSTADYGLRLQDHPLVVRASAWTAWSGSWLTVHAVVFCAEELTLELAVPQDLQDAVTSFHESMGVDVPDWSSATVRSVLTSYIDRFRMAGQEVLLEDAEFAGIFISATILVKDNYYQSEVRIAAMQALGNGPEGLFHPGNYGFGQSVHASDIYKMLMGLDGVESVCLNILMRVADPAGNQLAAGEIKIAPHQVAICDNDSTHPERGYVRLNLHGGLRQ